MYYLIIPRNLRGLGNVPLLHMFTDQIPKGVDWLKPQIEKAINAEIQTITEKLIKDAQEELNRKIPQIVAGVALEVYKHFSMERMGDDLLIKVQLEKVN